MPFLFMRTTLQKRVSKTFQTFCFVLNTISLFIVCSIQLAVPCVEWERGP